MFLRHKSSQDLVEVMDLSGLFDPHQERVKGRFHAGEEMPEHEDFSKTALAFPSGETLPECWVNPNYRKH